MSAPFIIASLPEAMADSEPLYTKNLSPVAGLFGLPAQRSARIGSAGVSSLALHGSVASHYVSDSESAEVLNFDGESQRLALEWRYGLTDNWDLQLEVPWLDHSGGQLDSLIDDWHNFWGLSDGGRSKAPADVLDFHYASAAENFQLQDDVSGIGDTSLSVSRVLYRDAGSTAAIALGYKFATGEEEDFLGSGADDVFATLRFSGQHKADLPLTWHGQLGYLRAGDTRILGDIQEKNLWFAGLALDWRIAERWSLLAQVDAHAAPADSAIGGLGDEAIMLTVGGRWRFSRDWAVDLSVVEDVRVETAPDVSFQASLRYRPGG
ncbi:MAG: DUF3187 family protein [Halioglobus sp.]